MTKISDTKMKEKKKLNLQKQQYVIRTKNQGIQHHNFFVNNEKKIKINVKIKIQVGCETFLSVLINLIIDLLK